MRAIESVRAYAPDLPAEDWALVRDTVLAVTERVLPQLTYPAAALVNAVAHHVDWAVNVAGYECDAATIFRRDVIGAGVAAMYTAHSSSMGRRRSILLRVGETLGVIAVPTPLPSLAAASPTLPYREAEIDELHRWADTQRDREGDSARALLALGLGCGLPTRDICAVRHTDVASDGSSVHVHGATPRLIPVADDWGDELAELRTRATDPELALFRPGATWSRNIVTVFVARSHGSARGPSTQRMRSTWLVRRLADGTPMQDLLSAAGLASMDALVRYEKFLPPTSLAAP